MSYSIDLATHGRELKTLYDSIVSSDPDISWAVFNYEAGGSAVLKPYAHGGSELEDFVEEFDDGKIQYGFVRVDYENLPKFVLVGWVGEGVPERSKGYFNAHYATVSKYFHGYHIQITARSADDLSSSIIYKRVQDSSGAKYSQSKALPLRPSYKSNVSKGASEEDWGDAPPITEKEYPTAGRLESSYKPTKIDLSTAKPASSISTGREKPEIVRGSYQPVGKVDIAAIRAQAKKSAFADDRPMPLQSSYKPVGKVDIAAIRAQASRKPAAPSPGHQAEYLNEKKSEDSEHEKVSNSGSKPDASEEASIDSTDSNVPVKDRMKAFGGSRPPVGSIASSDDNESPKSVHDRMAVFSGSGRLSELPKPKVANKVSERFTADRFNDRGTAPSLPKNIFRDESRAQSGFTDFASKGGKTPAQLWAEKHAKASGSVVNTSSSSASPPPRSPPITYHEQESEVEEEKHDISSLRNKFSNVGLDQSFVDQKSEPVQEQEPNSIQSNSGNSFAAITSQFASSKNGFSPNRNTEPQPEPEPEPQPEPEPEPQPEPELEPEPQPEPQPEQEDHSSMTARETIANAFSSGIPNSQSTEIVETDSVKTAIAAYDYDKDDDNEISLKEGEVITDIEFVDADWWQGRNSSGEIGLFPSNYVELEEKAPNLPSRPTAVEEEPPAPSLPSRPVENESASASPSAIAEYDYDAAEEGELTFAEGDVITEIEFVDESWWSGKLRGVQGLFPSNYVVLQ